VLMWLLLMLRLLMLLVLLTPWPSDSKLISLRLVPMKALLAAGKSAQKCVYARGLCVCIVVLRGRSIVK
jgi:hypothetical protein